jgi:hypothetical protein
MPPNACGSPHVHDVPSIYPYRLASEPGIHAQSRIETREALTHVTSRVEPTVPPEATAAKVGGRIYADVVVRANGTVESV